MAVFDLGDQIREFAKSADKRAEAVTKKIIFDISTRLVMKSPVGDPKFWSRPAPPGYVGGRFRGNWQYGVNKVDRTTTETIDKSGGPSLSRLGAEINAATALGNVHFITNSLPYAVRLEQGHSWRQAPLGIVETSLLEFDMVVRAAAAEIVK